ncbi:MAG: hypothetical protein RBS14_03755 [Atribacterota bacterium]|jgi:hypothetical protein|nr:hypothetical protein [Atribacterota bacterium]
MSILRKRLEALEQRRGSATAHTFQEMHKIQCPVIRARFKALYEPKGAKV